MAPGVFTTQLSSVPPASSSATDVPGSSERRLATAQPPEPAPTTTKSNESAMVSPCFLCSKAGLLRTFWQEQRGFWQEQRGGPVWSLYDVIKSPKVGSRAFPKRL